MKHVINIYFISLLLLSNCGKESNENDPNNENSFLRISINGVNYSINGSDNPLCFTGMTSMGGDAMYGTTMFPEIENNDYELVYVSIIHHKSDIIFRSENIPGIYNVKEMSLINENDNFDLIICLLPKKEGLKFIAGKHSVTKVQPTGEMWENCNNCTDYSIEGNFTAKFHNEKTNIDIDIIGVYRTFIITESDN